MRIALVALHFAEYSARLALALAQNHTVLLVLNTNNARHELSVALREALSHKVELVLIEHRKLRQPSVIAAAARLIWSVRAFKPDVVHFQEYLADYAAWGTMLLMAQYPSVLTVHDHAAHSGADSRLPLRNRWYRRLLRTKANRIVVHGETLRQAMLADQRTRTRPRIVSIMHGVLGIDDIGRAFDPPPDLNTLLFFGRIEAYKGLSVLLDALDSLDSLKDGAVRLIIAGRGSDLDTQRARIAKNPRIEVDDRFIPVEDVPELFARSAIAVLPYLDATQSGVAAMAFAFGRPVIASATGALPEVVRDGETGLLVPPADADALAQAIHRLITDQGLWKTLAQGALRCATGELSWANIAMRTTSLYEELYETEFAKHNKVMS